MEEVLECAAEDNLERLRTLVGENPTLIDAIGPRTVRSKKSNNFIVDDLTPLIVAAAHGSLRVLAYILSFRNVDVNRQVGGELTTALHSAASSTSPFAATVVRMLLEAGADRNLVDSCGWKPSDMAFTNPSLRPERKKEMIGLLRDGNDAIKTPPSGSFSLLSDDVIMYSFKVHLCNNQHPHNWTSCIFFHTGEKVRRRDLRTYLYSSEPCPYFKAGYCNKGDKCRDAHGTFEVWLHPSRYRTKWCANRGNCSRRICFFAHSDDELRVGSDVQFNRPILHNAVPPLYLPPSGDMDSVNWSFPGPRAMSPPNLGHGMDLQYVPDSNVVCGGSNLNLNSDVGDYQGYGMMNQPRFGANGHDDVVGGQIAELGDQFHNMELGYGEGYDMGSVNLPSRAMSPPNLGHGMDLQYVPDSNVACGGSNLNLNSDVGGYQGYGVINQPRFGANGHDDVVGGQTAELGDQFHNMELGYGEGHDMGSVNLPSRAMSPPNLGHGRMDLQYVPDSNAACGGSNLNLNSEDGSYQGHGTMNQLVFGTDGRDDVVGGQIAELGDQFHKVELGYGEEYSKTKQELIGNLFDFDSEWER